MLTSQPWSRRDDFLADQPGPDDADRLAAQLDAVRARVPAGGPHLVIGEGEAAQRRQDQPDRRLGDRVVVGAGVVVTRTPWAGGRVQVDGVVADAGPGDDLEARTRQSRRRGLYCSTPAIAADAVADRLGQGVLVVRIGDG